MAKDTVNRPSKELVLEESGLTLKMTYVVMNDILRFVGSLQEAMVSMMESQETRDLIIRRLLTDTKKPIEDMKDLIPYEEIELDIFEIDDVLAWVSDHVTYFFMRTAGKIQEATKKYPEIMQKMMSSDPSENGSTP